MLIGAAAFLVALLVTRPLARASGAGWRDTPSDADRERKPQRVGVSTVGGFVVLLAVWVAAAVAKLVGGEPVFEFRVPPIAGFASLFLAGAVGAWDDRVPGGLSLAWKLVAQAIVVAPLLLVVGGLEGVLLALAGLAAMNVANTWDHHDGTLASLSAVGFLGAGAPAWGGALLGFLPWNLNAKQGSASATPTAYLGDAGSHLLGLAAVLIPGAAWWLVLPALDLVGVAWRRVSLGVPPWRGDRRHLSHRLHERVPSRRWVALSTTLIALPGLLFGWPGVLATSVLYLGALYASRRRTSPDSMS